MKKLLLLIALVSFNVQALETIWGKVKKFEGSTVLTGKPYSYYAIVPLPSKDDEYKRFPVPRFLNASELAKNSVSIKIEADLERIYCIDMSASCMTHMIVNLSSVTIDTGLRGIVPAPTFKGKALWIDFVKFPIIDMYDGSRAFFPSFVNAVELYEDEPQAEFVFTGGLYTDPRVKAIAATIRPLGMFTILL